MTAEAAFDTPNYAATSERLNPSAETVRIRVYGASDDLIEVYGPDGPEEYNGDEWNAYIVGPEASAQIHVRCWYSMNGCWQISVGQVDEDVPFPDWPLRIRQGVKPAESAYSVVLEVDAPPGTRIEPLEA